MLVLIEREILPRLLYGREMDIESVDARERLGLKIAELLEEADALDASYAVTVACHLSAALDVLMPERGRSTEAEIVEAIRLADGAPD